MKTIMITGAASGVGKEIANVFKNERLILIDRNKEKLEKVISELNCCGYIVDVSDTASVRSMFESASKEFDKIDVLINCAGLWTKGELSKHNEEYFDKLNTLERIKDIIDTNTFGVISMIKGILPIMKKQGYGQIININSQSGVVIEEFCPVYNASKTGSRAFTKAILTDLAKQNIRLTDICPGLIDTDFYNNANDPLPKEIMNLGLKPIDVANLVKYIIELPNNISLPCVEIKDIKNY